MPKAVEYLGAFDKITRSADPVPLIETDLIVLRGADKTDNLADPASATQGTLYIDYTEGNLDDVTIKIYTSHLAEPGDDDWHEETDSIGDAGVITLHTLEHVLDSDGRKTWHFPIGAIRSLKVTINGGGADNTDSTIECTLGLRTN